MSARTDLATKFCAHNEQPLPAVVAGGEGLFVLDHEGDKSREATSACPAAACRNEAASTRALRFASES